MLNAACILTKLEAVGCLKGTTDTRFTPPSVTDDTHRPEETYRETFSESVTGLNHTFICLNVFIVHVHGLTWRSVVVGTFWPSCFKVLGLRPEKLSWVTADRQKQPHQIELRPLKVHVDILFPHEPRAYITNRTRRVLQSHHEAND